MLLHSPVSQTITPATALATPTSSVAIESMESPSPSSSSPTPSRLWRPAAQRNVRNQWWKLKSAKDRWVSAASEGRSHATSLVDSYLSQRYLPQRDFGALKDMPGIREKASEKLASRQDVSSNGLISSYKEMVLATCYLVKASTSMRCFVKGSVVSSIVQFCDHPADMYDSGDGGGIPVFLSYTISDFENLAQELVEMFVLELSLKRYLVLELLSICKEAGRQTDILDLSYEIYPGESNDLRIHGLFSQEGCQPLSPRIKGWESGSLIKAKSDHPTHEVFQVYLSLWLADVSIDMKSRIFATAISLHNQQPHNNIVARRQPAEGAGRHLHCNPSGVLVIQSTLIPSSQVRVPCIFSSPS